MKRGFWIWNIPSCENGDPLAIAAEASKAGLSDVFIKVSDGYARFNYDTKAKKDLVPAVISALEAVGINAWGWQYVYGYSSDATQAISRIKELGLKRFIVDAEAEIKIRPGSAEPYLKALKNAFPELTLGFSSYRYPHYHPEIPWATYIKYCDVNMPQVYWEQASNAGHQLQTSITRFKAMAADMPIYPVGATYKWNGWRPTLEQIQDFERIALENKIDLVSYWSWEHCRRDLPELWPKKESTGTPPGNCEERLSAIEHTIDGLQKALDLAVRTVSDLKTKLKDLGEAL